MRPLTTLLLLVAMFAMPPTAGAATNAQLVRQVASLKRSNATLVKQRNAAWIISAARRDLLAAQKVKAAELAATNAAALASMTTARDNALAGLPAAISAVPLASFVSLVLEPIRNAAQRAPCGDSYYASGSGYISYSFYAGTACNP